MKGQWYLNIEEAELFEASHAIPVFWLMGLNESDVRTSYEQIEQFYLKDASNSQNLEKKLCMVSTVPLQVYKENLEVRKGYIKEVYPEILFLYDEFIQKLGNPSYADKQVELWVDQFLGIPSDVELEYEQVKKLFECLETNIKTSLINEKDYQKTTIGKALTKFPLLIDKAQLTETLEEKQPSKIVASFFLLICVIMLALFSSVLVMIVIVFNYLEDSFLGFLVSLPFLIASALVIYGMIHKVITMRKFSKKRAEIKKV